MKNSISAQGRASLVLGAIGLAVLAGIAVWSQQLAEEPADGPTGTDPNAVESIGDLGSRLIDLPTDDLTTHGIVAPRPPGATAAGFNVPGTGVATYLDDFNRALISVSADLRTLSISIRERDEATATFDEWVLSESTSFDIFAFDGRGFEELFVAGIARNGDVVIEKWTIPASEGGRSTRWQKLSPGTSPGTPVGPMPGASLSTGEPYVAATERSLPTAITREEVYRGSEMAGSSAIEVDPWGRFVLVADFPNDTIWQVDLLDPPVVSAVVTPADQLGLSEATQFEIRRPELWDEGQKLWIFRSGASDSLTMIHITDVGFDASWDFTELLTRAQWNDAGYPAAYAEDYRNYGSIGFPHWE